MADPGDADPQDEARAADRAEDERLVLAVRAGDPDAFGRLYDRWFDRLHDLARRITRDDALAADVAQDAFLAAWQRLDGLDDPASFGGWLLRIGRNRALDVVRSAGHRRTEAVAEVSDERVVADRVTTAADPAVLAADREVQALVWEAAGALGERDLTALDLHLRHGLEPAEIGDVLGINRNAANQLVHRMRGRLATAVGCRVLWQGGRPGCAALRRELDAEGVAGFDARAVRLTDRHAGSCEACTRRRELRLDPAKLFAALPVPVVALAVKQQAAAALSGAGVPLAGSSAVGGGPPPTGPAGGEAPGSDAEADTDAEDAGRRASGRRRTVVLAAVGVASLLLALVLGAEALGDGGLLGTEEIAEEVDAAVPGTTTTTGPEGGMVLTTTSTTAPPAAVDPAPDAGAGAVVDPVPPVADDPVVVTVPPPAAPSATLAASPSRLTPVHPNGQLVVAWSTGGATSVSVSGPGLSSSAAAGSQGVCPGVVVSSVCRATPGTYTYRLTATGPGGTVERTAVVTVA